ncbi:unnamed protein product [Brachionus calyciflorus]|uniref:Uncharacterized protein n=1 Tax=Brachionus calyciflorus TaxID=104777 RepID=A0A813ZTD2_9BILA|nr:unnamed protein product [Brachionus calyciflorus]
MFGSLFLIISLKLLLVFGYDWKCTGVESLLEIEAYDIDRTINIYLEYQFTECIECDLLTISKLEPDPKNLSRFVTYGVFDPNFSYQIQVSQKNNRNETEKLICPKFTYNKFGECGVYRININNNCTIINLVKPNNIYLVLYYGIPLII